MQTISESPRPSSQQNLLVSALPDPPSNTEDSPMPHLDSSAHILVRMGAQTASITISLDALVFDLKDNIFEM